MSQRLLLAATSLAASTALAPAAFGFAEIARGTLIATASLTGSYDTNVFGNSTEVDDYSATFTPGLSYSRNVGLISSSANVGMKAVSFTDTNGQDTIDPFIDGKLTLDRAEKGSVSLSLGYARTTEANNILLTRTESDEYRAAANLDYYYSEKTGFRLNGAYRLSEFNTPGFNNVSSYSLGAGVLYRYSQKLTANATYSFSPEKASNLGGGLSDPSSDNHRFSVGLEGELAPKLNGSVNVGYAHRAFDTGDSDGTILFGASLAWAAAEKTNVTLAASNNFDTTAGADSARTFDVSLSVRQTLTEKLSLGASLGYQHSDIDKQPLFFTRTDEAYLLGVSLTYSINDNWNTNAAVNHRINESTLPLADYDRTVYSLGLSLSF